MYCVPWVATGISGCWIWNISALIHIVSNHIYVETTIIDTVTIRSLSPALQAFGTQIWDGVADRRASQTFRTFGWFSCIFFLVFLEERNIFTWLSILFLCMYFFTLRWIPIPKRTVQIRFCYLIWFIKTESYFRKWSFRNKSSWSLFYHTKILHYSKQRSIRLLLLKSVLCERLWVSVLNNIPPPKKNIYSPFHVSYFEDGFLWKFFLRNVSFALSLDLFHSLCGWFTCPLPERMNVT